MSPSPVNIKIIADAQQAIAQFQTVNTELGKMDVATLKAGGSITQMDKANRLASATMAAMAVGAAAFAVEAVKGALAAQVSFAKLNTALADAGLNSNAAREAAKNLAEQNTKLGFNTIATAEAYARLITATGNTKDSQQLLNLSMDLARFKHEDLATAADTLARGTQGSAKAFKEMGITLDATLPKQQAINKAFDELQKRLSGQNAAYLDTFSGKMSVLSAQFNAFKDRIGSDLIPILSSAMSLFQKYGGDILTFVGIVGGAVLAVKAFTAAQTAALAINALMGISLAAQIANEELLAAQTVILSGSVGVLTEAETALLAVTPQATGAMAALSLAMDANPIGAMVLGVVALVAALYGFIKVIGLLANSSSTPRGYSPDKNPNMGQSMLGRGYGQSLSKTDNTSTSDPYQDYRPGGYATDALTSGAFTLSGRTVVPKVKRVNVSNAAANAVAKALSKRNTEIQKYNDEAVKLEDQLNSAFSDRQTKMQDATVNRNASTLAANDAYNQTYADLFDKRNTAIANAQDNFQQTMVTAQTNYQQTILDIQDQYADSAANLTQASADKQKGIIQQSIALLTSTWQNATKIDIGSLFASSRTSFTGSTSASGLAAQMQTQLAAVLQLQKDAGKLAAAGYTQSFIDQVISQGTQQGHALADSVLKATPETKSSIQSLYSQITDVSDSGMDSLATSMNNGSKFATSALAKAYAAVPAELQKSLVVNNQSMNDALAKAQEAFNKQQAAAQLTLVKATRSANDSLNVGLASANDILSKALASANDAFIKSTKSISDNAMKQIDSLLAKLSSVAGSLKNLGASTSGIASYASSNGLNSANATTLTNPLGAPKDLSNYGGVSVTQTIQVNGSTAPIDIAKATVQAIKFGGLAGAGIARGN